MKTIFAIGVVLLFVLSLTGMAFAAEGMGTFHGKITAIDTNSGTVAVMPFQPVVSPSKNGGFVFKMNDMTNLVTCNGSGNLSDLKVGDEVNIMYREQTNGFVAQTVTRTGGAEAPLVACR